MKKDWLDEFMSNHTRVVVIERIEIFNDPEYPLGYVDIEIVNDVSWLKMFKVLEANNIKQTHNYKMDFVKTIPDDPKSRGRLAMNIINALRGAARRRGGLYASGPNGEKVWCEAPDEWLRVRMEHDFTSPVEDREGNPLC